MRHLLVISTVLIAQIYDSLSTDDDLDWTRANEISYHGPKYVQEGQTLQITCQMSRFYAPLWTHNDRPIKDEDEESTMASSSSATGGNSRIGSRVKFDFGDGVQNTRRETIIIHNVRPQDGGYYRCSSFSRKSHFVNVIPAANARSTQHTATHLKVFQVLQEENVDIEIDCKLKIFNPKAPVYWSKEGQYIEPDNRRYPKGSKLVIHNATSEQDAGSYLCRTDNMHAAAAAAEGGGGGSSPSHNKFGQIIELRAPIKVKPFGTQVVHKVQGESVRMWCAYTGYPKGKITWLIGNKQLNEKELEPLGIKLEQKEQPEDLLVIERLQLEQHSQAYTCAVNNKLSADERSFLIKVRENEVYISGPHVLVENRQLRISCNISEHSQRQAIDPRWYKDATDLHYLPDYGTHFVVEMVAERQWVLIIDNAQISDVGNYTCVHNNINATTKVRSKPMLYPFEEFQHTNFKSANIVEGDRFQLRCALAKGYERDAYLQWYRYKEDDAADVDNLAAHLLSINTTDPRITIESNDSTVSVLTISQVAPQDRYYYVCKSYNEVVSYNNTILLRVKERLAALWPFVGIVCEVLILCIIIFVYEKRRVKPDFDEPDNHNNDERRSPQDRSSRSQDVRQRR